MLHKTRSLVLFLFALLAACSQMPAPETEASVNLAPTFGSTSRDEVRGLAKHSSGVYAVGTVGDSSFVRKSDAAGNVLWDRYISGSASAGGVASDALDNAYVLGVAYANDRGGILISKYTPRGEVAWTRRVSANRDGYAQASGIAADGSGNVYIAGRLNGSDFLSKYSTGGSRLWTFHGVSASDVAVDLGGNVYVAGSILGADGNGSDMSLRKFSPSGSLLWARQVHYGSLDYGSAVAISGTHVYLVGNYVWDETTRDMKVAVTKYDPNGVQGWSRPYGLIGTDEAFDASADGDGHLYFAGYRTGGGQPYTVGFVTKVRHDLNGRELWTSYIQAPAEAATYNFAVLARTVKGGVIGPAALGFPDPIGITVTEVYAAGYTFGDLGAGHNGNGDAYLRRFKGADGSTVWTK